MTPESIVRRFDTPTAIVSGGGCRRQLAGLVRELGGTRVLVVTDPGVVQLGVAGEIVDALTSEPALRGYHLFPAVRGDLLAKLGRLDEACAAFELAASLTRNAREREVLLERAQSLIANR